MTSLFPHRFSAVEHPEEANYYLIDRGNPLHPDDPKTWAVFPYDREDRKSKAVASSRVRLIAGILNGVREPSEVIDVL